MRSLAAKQASVKRGTIIFGVDLAKRDNYVHIMNTEAVTLGQMRFTHDAAGYHRLREKIAMLQMDYAAPEVIVAMEPTGYYWKLVAAELEHHAQRYVLVNPYTVKKHREGDQIDRSKSDPRDAFFVGELTRTGKFTETQLLHGPYAELRALCVLDRQVQRGEQRARNHISDLVGQLFPELDEVFADFTGVTARALLRNHAIPAQLAHLAWETLVSEVRVDNPGKRLMLRKLRQAQALAATSVGLCDAAHAQQLALRMHIAQWELRHAQREEVRAAITELFMTLPEAPYMLSVPRLGVLAAAHILAEIGDPHRYRKGGQLIKLAGTQPAPNTSGQRTRSRTPMSHQGRPELRTTLYYAVLRLIQACPAFRAAYQRLQERPTHRLLPMEALGAMMNKLLRILWSLMRYEKMYDPARIN
jgi:transposase